MDVQTVSSEGEHTDSDLRIVLLGYNESGKSSTGNTILGSDVFDLKKQAECEKKEGVVAGRRVTVIDTPGRHTGYGAQDTPKLYQEEVLHSATLCPPGPHALLLIVNITIQFVEPCIEAVRGHLELFGKTVWNHVIVLFTHADSLGDTDIQQYIKEEGQHLEWLLEQCGNRFHVFSNKAKGDSTQVVELLRKIDEMVAGNHGSHVVLDKETLSFLAKRQRVFEEFKRNKEKRHSEETEDTRRIGDEHKLKKLSIVLLGRQRAGKTLAADTILNSWESGLKATLVSTSREAPVGRWQVTVVDTPGWQRDALLSQTPRRIQLEILKSLSLCSPGPHAFLLAIPANKTFTTADEMAINEHLELLGKKVWNHAIVLLTHADWMGDSPIELYIESEGEPLNRVLKKCGSRYHALSNMSQDQSQVETLLEKIEMMVAGNGFYEMNEQIQKDMADEGYEDETEDSTVGIFQLPSDPMEVSEQIQTKQKPISTVTPSSGHGTASLSEFGTTDSSRADKPNL